MQNRRISVAIASAALAVGIISACGTGTTSEAQEKTYISSDGPAHASVAALAKDSTLYIVGTVGKVLSREMDSGGLDDSLAENASMPVKFVDLEVQSSSNPTLIPPGNTVPVVWPDYGDEVVSEQTSDLVTGSEVLLFVNLRDSKTAPGIETVDSFVAPVGGENGVFDIDQGIAIARSPYLNALDASSQDVNSRSLRAPVASVTQTADRAWQ